MKEEALRPFREKLIDQTTIKFIFVGILNTLFGGAVMFLFYNLLGLSYWVSSACNYLFGSILSFFLNKYYTFQSREKSAKEVFRFILNILLCYLIAYGIARPLVKFLLEKGSVQQRENLAMGFGLVLFTLLNYLGQRLFVFQKKYSEEGRKSSLK